MALGPDPQRVSSGGFPVRLLRGGEGLLPGGVWLARGQGFWAWVGIRNPYLGSCLDPAALPPPWRWQADHQLHPLTEAPLLVVHCTTSAPPHPTPLHWSSEHVCRSPCAHTSTPCPLVPMCLEWRGLSWVGARPLEVLALLQWNSAARCSHPSSCSSKGVRLRGLHPCCSRPLSKLDKWSFPVWPRSCEVCWAFLQAPSGCDL